MFKISVIGCGRIAWLLENDPLRYKPCTHLGAIKYWLARDKKIKVTALCDVDLLRAKAAANFIRRQTLCTADFREALATKPDLLVIAASTAAHFPVLAAAIKANIKRIIMEKPVAFSAIEGKKLLRMLKSSRTVVLPNYERRYHPKYITLKKGLTSSSYRGFFAAGGKSLYANAKTGDEGVLLHDTTHLVDLAQFFFGPVKKFSVLASANRHVLYLEHAAGATGVIETSLRIGAFHLELELHTPDERIIVGNGFLERQKIRESPHYKNLRSYAIPIRKTDSKFPLAANPFVVLYKQALYGKPTNAHFHEAVQNIQLLDSV